MQIMTDSATASIQHPRQRKRRRPALACEQCRARKVRCDRNAPCATCVRSGNAECTYVPLPPRHPTASSSKRAAIPDATPVGDTMLESASSLSPTVSGINAMALRPHPQLQPQDPTSPDCSASSSSVRVSIPEPSVPPSLGSSVATVESLELRVKQLERELQLALGRQEVQSEPPSPLPGTERSLEEEPGPTKDIEKTFVPLPTRGIVSKTRFFGKSHWANGANLLPPKYKVLFHLMDRAQQEKTSKISMGFQKCKTLGRTIKARRVPHLPTLAIGSSIPDRFVADRLVDGYLRTFETVYRVLHVPTFQADYERYWEGPNAADQAFVVLMQLCMAIGACFYDDNHSLRAQATAWIYEARFWLLLPPEKARLTITGLQIMCLLQIARQTAGVSGGITWISAGALLRAAVSMGLHHDPKNLVRMPLQHAETRRRLWATILEMDLQSSLDAGSPPLLSLCDFDTRMPARLNDRDITNDGSQHPSSEHSWSTYTQTSPQIALFESFATRLAITKLLNDPQSQAPDYQETLRLSAELTSSTRTLMQRLYAFPRDGRGVDGVSPFQLRFIEMTMNHYALVLHLPWWNEALRSPTHYFSRKMSVDAARALAELHRTETDPSPSVTDFGRLLVCGSGPSRSGPVQACLTLTLEYLHLKEEEKQNRGLMSNVIAERDRAQLRSVFEWQNQWWIRRIRAGETNVKSYAFGQVFDSLTESLESGLGPEATMALIVEQATVRVDECYEMLKSAARDVGIDVDAEVDGVAGVVQQMGGTESFDMELLDYSFLDNMTWGEDTVTGLNTLDLLFK